jgi:hypothetical protein
MALIVVSGALANKPGSGGAAWTRLSWVLGLKRLGHDVYFVEQITRGACVDEAGATCAFDQSVNLAYFQDVTERFGLSARSALVCEGDGGQSVGLSLDELERVAEHLAVV